MKGSPNLVEAKIDTQKELAKVAGVSHGTLAKVETINASADVILGARRGSLTC